MVSFLVRRSLTASFPCRALLHGTAVCTFLIKEFSFRFSKEIYLELKRVVGSDEQKVFRLL